MSANCTGKIRDFLKAVVAVTAVLNLILILCFRSKYLDKTILTFSRLVTEMNVD